MYLAYLLTFFLALYLVYLRRFFVIFVVEAGSTAIKRLQLRSGGDHCDHELAVEVAEEEEEEEDEEAGGTADITSNNPHLTGGEKTEDVNRQNGLVSGIHQGTCSKNRAKVRCDQAGIWFNTTVLQPFKWDVPSGKLT